MEFILEMRGICKRFDNPAGGPATAVLGNIDLQLEPGESLAIVGPSGSGKSTLLNIAGSLEPPSSGSVLYQGTDLASLDAAGLAQHRSQELGFVFQQHHLLPQCSALENVLLPTLALASGRPDANSRAQELLKRVGLGERMQHRPGQLSGGERQRVALVRALINAPRLMLLDEPTGSLDKDSTGAMAELLLELNQTEQVAMIMVTHSMEMAARMQRSLTLEAGTLVPSEVAR